MLPESVDWSQGERLGVVSFLLWLSNHHQLDAAAFVFTSSAIFSIHLQQSPKQKFQQQQFHQQNNLLCEFRSS